MDPSWLDRRLQRDVGIYLVDPYSGDGIGALISWLAEARLASESGLRRTAQRPLGIRRCRFSGLLVTAGNEFPLHLSWVAGAGFGVGDDFAVVSFPLGLALGRAFQAETVVLSPYIGPRLALDAFFGRSGGSQGNGSNDDVDQGFAVDFGLDLNFDPGWAVRFGVSGGRDAIAIGASFSVL